MYKSKINDIVTNKLEGTVISNKNNELIVYSKNNGYYTFKQNLKGILEGDRISILYAGLLDKNKSLQDTKILSYTPLINTDNEYQIPNDWLDEGIFSDYYILAYDKLQKMSLDEKIGQLLLVRYSDDASNIINNFHVGGFIFFEKDFKDKNKVLVKNMINKLQNDSPIPLLIAVDEEGGSVVRISSNSNLVNEPFKAPRDLYLEGGFERIKNDTIIKNEILKDLGINLNLAPVVDVSTDENDYIYKRTLGENTDLTSTYAEAVIKASKNSGVSYTLKHFPGYGNAKDTHNSTSTIDKSYEDIINIDIPPFKHGINAGAEAVLFSHNIMTNIDSQNPASLSKDAHNLLRNELKFTGISMTDDLSMKAVLSIPNVAVKAILAGNEIIITTDYEDSLEQIKGGISNGDISEDLINKLCFKVLAWKYYKGLMYDNQK